MHLEARVQRKGVQLGAQQDVALGLVGKDQAQPRLVLLVLQDGLLLWSASAARQQGTVHVAYVQN